MAFTDEELIKIKVDLPKGANQKLAEKFDMHPSSIRKILAGQRINEEVVLAAYELSKEHKTKMSQVKAELSA